MQCKLRDLKIAFRIKSGKKRVVSVLCCKLCIVWVKRISYVCRCFVFSTYFMSVVITSISTVLYSVQYKAIFRTLIVTMMNAIEVFKTTWYRDICVTVVCKLNIIPFTRSPPMACVYFEPKLPQPKLTGTVVTVCMCTNQLWIKYSMRSIYYKT